MNVLTRIFHRRHALLMGVALALLGAQPVSATHKSDHRYTVWGEIKYEDGQPASEVTVHLLVKGGEQIGEVKADRNGRYRIVLHVHNEDVYKVFDMRVNNVTRKVRLLFNPNDVQTERGQRIDLVVEREAEVETSELQTQ